MWMILSLFPGIGLLDRAFEQEWPDACLVRGPDVLWGGDVHAFHAPPGVFDGVIGGPPCQAFSRFANIVRANGYEPKFGNLIPEFQRVVEAAQPAWFLMENVTAAPTPDVNGYATYDLVLNNRWVGGEQRRTRRFSFGTRDGRRLDVSPELVALEPAASSTAVVASLRATPVRIGGSGNVKTQIRNDRPVTHGTFTTHGTSTRRYSIGRVCELQGLPADFLHDAPFTQHGKLKALANGVPLPMGRAIARTVRRAMGLVVI